MKDEFIRLKKNFDETGFVIVENLLDDETLANLLGGLEKITGNADSIEPELANKLFFERQHVKNNPQYYKTVVTPEECGNAVRQIDDLPLFGSEFANLICYLPLLDTLEILFGNLEFSFNMMIGRPKPALIGNGISDGNFHRDTPFEDFTEADTVVSILCLDDMTSTNGGTQFIGGSHKIAEEEARKQIWRDVDKNNFSPEKIVTAQCPAGSGIFFDTKILHAAGHNRSNYQRRTIQMEWVGAESLPTSPGRHAFQGLKPRSKQAAFIKQIKMAFPHLFASTSATG